MHGFMRTRPTFAPILVNQITIRGKWCVTYNHGKLNKGRLSML